MVTAHPASGYQVDSWGDDCSGGGTYCRLTMDMPYTASVTFEVRPPPPPDPDPEPTVTIFNLVAGYQEIVWPGDTVAVATAVRGRPIEAVWHYDAADAVWYVYVPGAPDFVNSLADLETGLTYGIRASEAFTWRVTDASASARSGNTADDGVSGSVSGSGWSATVVCDSGRSPIRLAVAPTEAEAASAAQWLIAHAQGCGGAGTYTLSFRS